MPRGLDPADYNARLDPSVGDAVLQDVLRRAITDCIGTLIERVPDPPGKS